jgi:hypothetical protein
MQLGVLIPSQFTLKWSLNCCRESEVEVEVEQYISRQRAAIQVATSK